MNKFESEYESICSTQFWKEYVSRYEAFLHSTTANLLVCPLDLVERTRGSIEAIEFITRLPNKIIKSINTNIEEGE